MIGLQVVNCGDLARPIYSDSSQHPPIFENKDAPFLSGYMEASQMRGESRRLETPSRTTWSGSDGKETACNAGDPGSIPGSERFPGEGNDNPLQYPCLENSMDRGAWWATVQGVTKGRTRLSD